uniref:Uncharacterized protein n=1 Tax=Anopheles albimanus TaxID=7167 RepID=A0A182FYM5_ANOAL
MFVHTLPRQVPQLFLSTPLRIVPFLALPFLCRCCGASRRHPRLVSGKKMGLPRMFGVMSGGVAFYHDHGCLVASVRRARWVASCSGAIAATCWRWFWIGATRLRTVAWVFWAPCGPHMFLSCVYSML